MRRLGGAAIVFDWRPAVYGREVFLASGDVADVDVEVGDAPLAEYFSRSVPHAMALRYVPGDECRRPCNGFALVVIDDQLLQASYGFLKFESVLRLTEQYIVRTINSMAPNICWSNLEAAVGHSILTRRASDGTHHVRAYSGTVRISNESSFPTRYFVEWPASCAASSIERVLVNEARRDFEIGNAGLSVSMELPPAGTCSLVHRNLHAPL